MITRRHSIILVLSLSLSLLYQSVGAVEENQPHARPADPPRSLLSLTEEQARGLKPMDQEIRALLIEERGDVAALTALLSETSDNQEALRIQREVSAKKQQTEMAIMEVQAKYATRAGRLEQATALRAAIATMKEQLDVELHDAGAQQ